MKEKREKNHEEMREFSLTAFIQARVIRRAWVHGSTVHPRLPCSLIKIKGPLMPQSLIRYELSDLSDGRDQFSSNPTQYSINRPGSVPLGPISFLPIILPTPDYCCTPLRCNFIPFSRFFPFSISVALLLLFSCIFQVYHTVSIIYCMFISLFQSFRKCIQVLM